MTLNSHFVLKIIAVALIVVTLVALDMVLTGGEVIAGRHGSSF
jgi:hypothetical protein